LPFRNWLFDFDGTLVDSAALHDSAYRQALDEHSPELRSAYAYDAVRGKATREAFAALGAREPQLTLLTSTKQRTYRDFVAQQRLQTFTGAQELLGTLTDLGCAIFLVTSGSRESVLTALSHTRLGCSFSGVTTAEDVRVGKPAPTPYLCCMESFGLQPRACVVVEDAVNGVVAARRAGVAVFGVHDASLVTCADQFFPSLGALERWIDSRNEGAEVP
jgi:HAD superfamily hydrolase (TIGR01509 family)